MKLIDAEALLAHIKDLPTWWEDDGGVYGKSMKYPEGMFDCEDVVSSVENTPTVDAVAVTRCKDCRFNIERSDGSFGCYRQFLDYHGPNDFCSQGEPKEV